MKERQMELDSLENTIKPSGTDECCGCDECSCEFDWTQESVLTVSPPTDRFDLEQQIMDAWHIVDDIKILHENVLENGEITMDKVSNVLSGLEDLYQMKFEKLFRTFETLIRNKNLR